jgi:hypothetical protein
MMHSVYINHGQESCACFLSCHDCRSTVSTSISICCNCWLRREIWLWASSLMIATSQVFIVSFSWAFHILKDSPMRNYWRFTLCSSWIFVWFQFFKYLPLLFHVLGVKQQCGLLRSSRGIFQCSYSFLYSLCVNQRQFTKIVDDSRFGDWIWKQSITLKK